MPVHSSGSYPADHPSYGTALADGRWPFLRGAAIDLVFDAREAWGAVFTPGDLILNGGFDSGAYWTLSVNGGTGTAEISGGTLNLTGDGTNAAVAFATMQTEIGQLYILTLTAGLTTTSIGVGIAQGGSTLLNASLNASTGSFAFVATTTTTHLYFARTTATLNTVDNVSCRPAAALGRELVKNGDFSRGAEGWTLTTAGTATANVVDGVLNLTGDGVNGAAAEHVLTTVAGRTYRVSFDSLAGATGSVQVGSTSGGGELLGSSSTSPSTSYTYYFTATSTTSYLRFPKTGAATYKVDDVSVQEVTAIDTVPGLICTRASVGYAETANAIWRPFAINVPRITDRGMLVEEARTNSIRNNSMQGLVPGTPGTMPTNWSSNTGGGVSQQILGIGTENGVEGLYVRYTGTGTGVAAVRAYVESGVAATNGQVWTASAFVRVVAGTLPAGFHLASDETDPAYLRTNVAFITPTGTLQRFSGVFTNQGVTTTAINAQIGFNTALGIVYDVTLFIGWPQLELGGFATSPIRTTTAIATRSADDIWCPEAAMLLTQASYYAEIDVQQVNGSTAWRIFETNDSAGNPVHRLRCNGLSAFTFETGSAPDGAVTGPTITTNGTRLACRAYTNDTNLSVNGAIGTLDTTAIVPSTPVRIAFGNTPAASPRQLNGYLKRWTLFPEALTDAELQQLTSGRGHFYEVP